ncbi:rhomboid family intramembrane serine protease [Flavobacterium sp. NKUCC04_CG]|uniref:rhomboid family intramembrane serine protease n=1 Tax=Flavobacterium sp. NKUCC04_CG TaxID=2842121 RepID=UPI001C5BA9D5|nr:rhomboid family intramembrane serine protease [Flavobacterium sp. NKUCC04_CG]MBW3517914.1 rhomboid family intramembrane serine protease [Flavobacterium sp. NKUCC04_CG]
MIPILLVVILVTVLVSFKGFNDPSFFSKYEFHIGRIQNGEKYRMISSGFLHADIGHLFFNMFTLYMFAPIVISYYSSFYFILIYAGSLLVGNVLTLSFYKNNPYYRAIGASGAVMGVLYASILLNPGMNLYLFFIPIPIPAYIFGIGYLSYSIYGMKKNNDNIGHAAHFGGAIGGFVLTLIKSPEIISNEPILVGLLLIPIIVLFVLIKTNKL